MIRTLQVKLCYEIHFHLESRLLSSAKSVSKQVFEALSRKILPINFILLHEIRITNLEITENSATERTET